MSEVPASIAGNLDAVSDSKKVQRLEFVIRQSKVLASILSEKLEKKQEELRNAEVRKERKEERKEVKEKEKELAKEEGKTVGTRTRRAGAKVEASPSIPCFLFNGRKGLTRNCL